MALTIFWIITAAVWVVVLMFWLTGDYVGFRSREIDYGNGVKGVIYYKTSRPKINLAVGGKRQEWMDYTLRDERTRWTKFYLLVNTMNGKVMMVLPMNFSKVDLDSKLQNYLVNCKPTSLLDILTYEKDGVQKLIDQIQYQPLNIKV